MLNGKVMRINLIYRLIKKTLYKMSQYFPKPYQPFRGDIDNKVDWPNYATKDDVKKATEADISQFVSKSDLASLKAELDQTDVDKLKTVPVHFCKLNNEVDNEVIKRLCMIN